jgi:hypothetical protein
MLKFKGKKKKKLKRKIDKELQEKYGIEQFSDIEA